MTTENLIRRARRFAVGHHSAVNQRRKYTGEPYWTHPMAVANTVAATDCATPEMVAAAWLHDTVEDTNATIDDVYRLFGELVGCYVTGLTDISDLSWGNRAFRKQCDLAHLANTPEPYQFGVYTVKLADIMDNTKSITQHAPGFARVYLKEIKATLDVIRRGNHDKDLFKVVERQVLAYNDALC